MRFGLLLLSLFSSVAAYAAAPGVCAPAPEIQTRIQRASAVPPGGKADFDRNIAPFKELRQRNSGDLFVNEVYQDAVRRYGIEGHLRVLTEEYLALSAGHSGEPEYRYLYNRSLVGRNTRSAVQGMTEILAEAADFAPAHRTLAEIYATAAFGDPGKEEKERQSFLAICPGASIGSLEDPLPDPSPLVDQAEKMISEQGDPKQIEATALRGIRDNEWRLQRIRPFDWYSVDFKQQAQHDLQSQYWKLWSIQVRCYRMSGQTAKAENLLRTMEQRSAAFRGAKDPLRWQALSTLARLYAAGNQKDLAKQKLNSMRDFLAASPDPNRKAEFEDLQGVIEKL